MTRLILARHGNTFAPEDKPVWVGARTDLPLVDKGVAQARAIGEALRQAGLVPSVLSCGPLRRTRETAAIIMAITGFDAAALRIDDRLREIDYGAWEGKSTDEIIATGGDAELAGWNKNGIFPPSPGWSPDEAQLRANAAAILGEATRLSGAQTAMAISSNGILRFFAAQAVNAAAFPDRKVATGHVCVMEHGDDGWHIRQWNAPPAVLAHIT
ncbi:MAG: histidine phosphatase family protein [Alphaproteobacteria bacterium]|nr:histidine phosphatase family protein [Alphaproteobacteria bacterium]